MSKNSVSKKIYKVKEAKWRGKVAWFFSAPAGVANLLFGWYPLILGFIVAFQTFYLIRPAKFTGLQNFRMVLSDPIFFKTYINTFYYTALDIGLVFFIPIIVSILLMELRKSHIRILMLLWFIPLPGMASIIIWKYFYAVDYGLFNGILKRLGLPLLGWLNDPNIAMLCLVLPGLIMFGPGLIYIATIQSIPDELYEAADLEGASIWQKIWHITLPRMRPLLAMMLLLATISDMQVFDQPFVMTGGGPGIRTYMVVMNFYDYAFRRMYFGRGAAIAFILFFVVGTMILIQRKYFKENIDR